MLLTYPLFNTLPELRLDLEKFIVNSMQQEPRLRTDIKNIVKIKIT